ncbi:hypothetical protein PCANC_18322 [Puccinia coronata f. sp. avenae]|uniref:Uncharacterized protein n=1 Tax=Puccinia coronata f. sp. avenae TaxID=200324 RepID=A0A2N5SGE1_9BASI|nr:hypothetical protein PCANC_18322 [Puccinia coronata f. sp. avenae]
METRSSIGPCQLVPIFDLKVEILILLAVVTQLANEPKSSCSADHLSSKLVVGGVKQILPTTTDALRVHPNTYQLDRQTYGQDEEDYEYCRPRGSTIGDCEPDIFGGHRRRGSFGLGGHLGNQGAHNMYGSMYGMGMMGASPREQMMRAQMMRGDLYSMDPMMSRMGMGSGYGGMYGGMGGYGMCGPGSIYGGGMMGRSMMGMGPMGGMGMGMGMYGGGMYGGMYGRPYRMSGLVETPSPHLTRAKTWSAYGRLY